MSPTPNLAPCRSCGRMPKLALLNSPYCGNTECKDRTGPFHSGEEWNLAQQVEPAAMLVPRNDTEAQQQDAHRLAALLREAAEIVERMAGRL